MRGLMTRMRLTGKTQERRDHASRVEWHLCGRAQDQAFVSIPIADADMGFDRRLLDLMDVKSLLEDVFSLRETTLHIADIRFDEMTDVALRVVGVFQIRFVVDDGRAGLDGFILVEDRGQDFVIDLDQLERFLGDLL